MNLIDVNLKFADDILPETLLTTQVENLYVVSHFKHETFTVLQYAQDFGTIVKESIKRTSRWAAKYYTHYIYIIIYIIIVYTYYIYIIIDTSSRRHGGRFKALSKICYLSVSTCYNGQSYPEECG